jgi:hypothetical protein
MHTTIVQTYRLPSAEQLVTAEVVVLLSQVVARGELTAIALLLLVGVHFCQQDVLNELPCFVAGSQGCHYKAVN